MIRLLQINITANWGSHGRIAEEIGQVAMSQGWDSYIAYGRYANPSASKLIRIGSMWDERFHGLQSRLFDNHGLASKRATKDLLQQIERINPDMIHLHNIHGYYLNYPLLFEYLSQKGTPVVWTLHDCWTMTGHCAYFTYAQCEKWKEGCRDCNFKSAYPKSVLFNRSERNFKLKQAAFCSVRNMTLVPVSSWLASIVPQSILKSISVQMIHNGIDLYMFKPVPPMDLGLPNEKKIVLGVSSVWEKRKGLEDFYKLGDILDDNYQIVIVGLTEKQKKQLPPKMIGVSRTNSAEELAAYYSAADVFVNPTYEDNFPTTNLEALACGTPVITYRTGGSPEAIDEQTGIVVDTGDVNSLAEGIRKLCNDPHQKEMRKLCRQRAVLLFNKNDRYQEYLDLYNRLLEQ